VILIIVSVVLVPLFLRSHPGVRLKDALDKPVVMGPMVLNWATFQAKPLEVRQVYLYPREYEGAYVSVRGVPGSVMGAGKYSAFWIVPSSSSPPSETRLEGSEEMPDGLLVLSEQIAPRQGVPITVRGWIKHVVTFDNKQVIVLCEFAQEPPENIFDLLKPW
jgi:hypothetical protein